MSPDFENKSFKSIIQWPKQLQRPRNGVNECRSEVKTVKSAQNFVIYVSTHQSTETLYKLTKYQIDHIYKKNINTSREKGNNKNILMAKRIILQIAQKYSQIKIHIAGKTVN